MGAYLYAIAAGTSPLALDNVGGVPDGTSECRVVEAAGLRAVISDYRGPPFSDLSRRDLLGALLAHQQVLEQIISRSPVLPVKFGTVLQSDDEARALLERFQDRLHHALKDVGDSVEIDLSATWDQEAVFAEVTQSPDLLQARADVSHDSDLATRVRVGMLVQEALEERRELYRRQILGSILPLARDAQPHPRPSDDLVVNVAFLVPQSSLEAFDTKIDECGETFADRLSFRYVGPLPPYSFATVEISQQDAAEIEVAREQLGLRERFSEQEVKAHFRELAGKEHPDLHPGDPSARERFDALTAARDRLMAYIRGQSGDEAVVVADRGAALLKVVRADEYLSPDS